MQQGTMRDLMAGANQSGLRDQNARVVLSYIRRHGEMASAEIARRSGLSAQTVSNIVRALEADGLLLRGATTKGRVGKPSVPMGLNPEGAFSLGINIGRRSLELVLVDFLGRQVEASVTAYDYPSTAHVFGFIRDTVPDLLKSHGIPRTSVAGIGVAHPNRIWDWLEFVNAPEDAMAEWRGLDVGAEIGALTGLDPVVGNDATAACVAEHMQGRGNEYNDFAYIFLGSFVGGGLVLDGKIVPGRTNNAAAFGPLPVPDGKGGTVQLLDVASLHVLERALDRAGLDSHVLRAPGDDWSGFDVLLEDWIDATASNLAIACAAVTSIVEVEAILVEGAFPRSVRARLTGRIEEAFSRLDVTGIQRPKIEEATVGRRARSVGAALLPIHAKYFLT